MVTDSSGNVAEQLGHYPYGESWYNASNDKLFFTTYERDAESGNDYAQARYYVSRLGRFSSTDPLAGNTGDPQSLNRYVYARDLPMMLVDPSGQDDCPQNARRKRKTEEEYYGMGMGLLPFELEEMSPVQSVEGDGCYGGGDAPLDGGTPPNPCDSDYVGCVAATPDPCDFDPAICLTTVPIGGGGGGNPVDLMRIKTTAIALLIGSPDCSSLFGGLQNALSTIAASSYFYYMPGEANPAPNLLSSDDWNTVVQNFSNPNHYGGTLLNPGSGGITFFGNHYASFNPGFNLAYPAETTQLTGFFHELEHGSNHEPLFNQSIDKPGYANNDAEQINTKCLPSFETENSPITGQLTLP
jgi:RHS repeat-associated protein